MALDWKQLGAAALTGVAAHLGYFIHGEHDLQAANIAGVHMAAGVALGFFHRAYEGLEVQQAVYKAFLLLSAYAGAMFTSIIIYRLVFSPLKHIPGPLGLRWSKLPHMLKMASRRNCEILEDLRLQYGDVVRTGPNEVTVFGLDAYNQVHGPDTKCWRAAYYEIVHPMVSLDTTRDEQVHTRRRKLWDQAFSIKSLDKAEPLVYSRANMLKAQLLKRQGESLDVSTWLEYYTFDLMGLFGLTIDFENLTKGQHPILGIYHMAHYLLGPLACVPWLKHLMMGIPFVERMKYYRQFFNWAHQELERNIKNNKEERQNIIGYVISEAESNGGVKENWNYVLGDFVLVIIAGSDPVRQVLANMMYYMIQKPESLAEIRKELEGMDINDYKKLQYAPLLNAAIYETIRLNPAVPSAGLRLPPPGGMEINGTYIPEWTTIVTPQYSLMRDERYFVKPEEWIPERFTSQPELIFNKNAFVPWAIGKKSCLGKNLSLMEIRVAAALIFTEFDFEPVAGEDGTRMFTEATDFFTTTPGPLNLYLKSRER